MFHKRDMSCERCENKLKNLYCKLCEITYCGECKVQIGLSHRGFIELYPCEICDLPFCYDCYKIRFIRIYHYNGGKSGDTRIDKNIDEEKDSNQTDVCINCYEHWHLTNTDKIE